MKNSVIIKKSLQIIEKTFIVTNEFGLQNSIIVSKKSLGKIKNNCGDFWLYIFEVNDIWKEYLVLIKVSTLSKLNLLPEFISKSLTVRIDSGCLTGNLFNDLSCDCKLQLENAMKEISETEEGLIIYIPSQDGRGFGLINKLPTLTLIYEKNLDTIQAFHEMTNHKKTDVRSYDGAIAILKFLGIDGNTTISLLSGSTNKSNSLKINGFPNVKNFEKQFPVNEIVEKNLKSKKENQ